ncbi:DNA replication and repair protein RecR [Mycoplasma testudineum]|uniref:Recombination protein RecR n=1 Tax=Mycoplasma testudineum TaxID=244584 RepID=A0A4R6IEE3_9MOLU|nr:toprim domain-containing protein [Mycoplasma testudineum]OYD26810.1 recombination protein RecR [Mycoplasma testudineum]TDO20344.1 DNA replication and repair protein RecR [Mycoplasma testudineum]
MQNIEFENAILQLSKLNGVSKKGAIKIAQHIIKYSSNNFEDLISSLNELREKTKPCLKCNLIQSELICSFCNNAQRRKTLMIFEISSNVFKFEKLGIYNGYYFITDPLLSDRIIRSEPFWMKQLINYIDNGIEEIVFAISPTLSGEITMQYIKTYLANRNIKTSRFAVGLPINSEVDYIDDMTLTAAFKNRTGE